MKKLIFALLASVFATSVVAQTAADTTNPSINYGSGFAVKNFGGVPGLSYYDSVTKSWKSVPVAGIQLPAPTSSTLGGVQAATGALHQFQIGVSTGGSPLFAQPQATDVSGLALSATTDTTNAGNITAGTLGTGRLPVIPPANGGCGVASLSGILKGNGTSPCTAAVPNTDFETPSGPANGFQFTAPGTGGSVQALGTLLAQTGLASNYGAVCDGVTDSGPAINRAFAAGYQQVVLNGNACTGSGAYVINTTVNVPAGGGVHGQADGMGRPVPVITAAAVTTFAQTGDHGSYDGMYIKHTGTAGYIFGINQYSWVSVRDVEAWAANATNPNALYRTTGAQNTITNSRFINCRPNAYAIDNDSSTTAAVFGSSVNLMLSNSVVFSSSQASVCNGTGSLGLGGMHVWSSDGTSRPEGVSISNSVFQMESARNLEIEQILNFNSSNTTYDSSSTLNVDLKPTGQGIDGLTFTGGYMGTPLSATNGVCVSYNTAGTAILHNLIFTGINFGGCGYGFGFATVTPANTNGLVIADNTFQNVGSAAINLQSWKKASIANNSVANASGAVNLILSDGASGGPYSIDGNQWDSAGAIAITETTPSNFHFGQQNTGKLLAGVSAATVAISAAGCVGFNVPHGLAAAPNIDKVLLTARIVSGTMSNVTATVASVDATNVTTTVCVGTFSSAGNVRITAEASL